MSDDSEFLDKLLEAIADGDSIDRTAIERKILANPALAAQARDLLILYDFVHLHGAPPNERVPGDEIPTLPSSEPPTGEPGNPGGDNLGWWRHLKLLRKIGEGTFGDVYHAFDPGLDHPFALKLVKSKFAGTDVSKHVLAEARKLVRVRHPNVVVVHGVHDADASEARAGFWMDLVEGETLSARVARGRLSAGEARDCGQQVCRALIAVHFAKLVHRDVKAQNVMRSADGGRIVLMDFGLGEFTENQVRAGVRGTLPYIAPEVFDGREANHRIDIYAVGVLLYYLVTGSFPVRGASKQDFVEAHARGERRRLRDEGPDLPDAFIAIVERAIDPDPSRRYGSAGEMLDALAGETSLPDAGTPAPKERTATLFKTGALVLTAAIVATEIAGFIACRFFEGALHVDPDFRSGASDYFTTGSYALFPVVFFWAACAAVVGVLAGLRMLFRARMDSVERRWASRLEHFDPAMLASVIFLLGLAGFVVITASFSDLFQAISSLTQDPRTSAATLWRLSPVSHSVHSLYGVSSVGLSFLLGWAAWFWFPRLEKRAAEATTIRVIKWATVAVAVLVVALTVAIWRILWDRFEVVMFENQRALVIGSNSQELLLYAPDTAERSRWRVRKDASSIKHTNEAARELFDFQKP